MSQTILKSLEDEKKCKSYNNLEDCNNYYKINEPIKKILINRFPHNGTSILKSIIGHIENIY